MTVWAVVLAAGSSVRYGRPKQFELLVDHRLVDWAVASARRSCDGVVVALPPGVTWDGDPGVVAVTGGATHAESGRAAVAAVPTEADVIVVGTASHPLASPSLIARVAAAVDHDHEAAVAVFPFADMLVRLTAGAVTDVIDKTSAVIAQSPSAFRASTLRALMAPGSEVSFELELVVRAGGRVATVPGEATNVHVTTPEEMAVAEALAPLTGWSP